MCKSLFFATQKVFPPLHFFVWQFVYPCQNKLKKIPTTQYVLGIPEKGFPFVISASIRIDQGSHCYLYAGFFSGLLETGCEDKQGEYVKPLLREHKKVLPCSTFSRLFNSFDHLGMSKIAKKTSNLWIYFSLLMQLCDGGYTVIIFWASNPW